SSGTKLGMKTEVSVGVNPEIRRELASLTEQHTQKERKLKMISNGLARFKMELQAGKTFTPTEHQRVQKLIEAHQVLKDELAAIEQKKNDLEAIVSNSKRGRIVVYDRVYPGVKVSIGKDSLVVPDEIQNVSFFLRDNELAQGSAV
ncbi:MAG: FapA family protein, partial [Limnochordia bacterium]|nr:FapA family protein [Limnochordia bacterium]